MCILFKAVVAQMLVSTRPSPNEKQKQAKTSRPQTVEPFGSIVSPHILLGNQGKMSACCYI
jgi:hypothetical protein